MVELLAKNNPIRDGLGITVWHKAGYTGKRCTVLTGERFEGSGADDHGKKTYAAFLEIAPDAKVKYAEFPITSSKVTAFVESAKQAQAMFYSCSTTVCNFADRLDSVMPESVFVAVSAGNHAEEKYNHLMKPESVYGVGAVSMYWSKYIDDYTPAPNAVASFMVAQYTAFSDYVDFAAPAGLIVGGEKFTGTSCSCPVLVGMATLVNDFFIDKTGKPLTHKAMYQFLKDCSKDVYKKGEDVRTGWGVPILPDPKTIDIAKYQPDYQEEEEMNYEAFCELMARYEEERSKKPEPKWSKNEGAWSKAKKAKVLDGTRPEDPVKRVELATILDRLGLIK